MKLTDQITFVVNSKLSQILSGLKKNILVTSYEDLNLKILIIKFTMQFPKYLNIKSSKDINFFILKNINKLQDQIFLDDKRFNIGIAWSGNKEYFLDSYRSIPLKHFENIFKLKNINFYKLSKDRRDEDKNKYDKFSNIIDLGNNRC